MKIEVMDDTKRVYIWLTRAEQDDAQIKTSLKSLYQQYKAMHYLVAVFLSGEESLEAQTRDLLLYNRTQLAGQRRRKSRDAAVR